jgi:hypothetical protein
MAGQALAALPDDIVLFINFDEGQGDQLVDHSATKLVLKLVAGKAAWEAGKNGKAIVLDGSTAFQAEKGGDVAKLKGTISVGAWVKPKAMSGWQNLIEMDAPAGQRANKGWKTGFNNQRLVWTTYEVKDHFGQGDLQLGKWQHVTYTYDGKSAKMYIDGKLDKEEPGSGTFDASDKVVSHIDVGWRRTTSSSFFTGSIDELWVSNVVKSEAQIRALMDEISLAVEPSGKAATTWGAVKGDR